MLSVVLILMLMSLIPALAAADSAAPTISITWPQEGLTIASETIEVRVAYEAASDSAVAQVSLVVDGRMVDAREIDPPEASGTVSFVWAAGKYEEGDHEITVRATDSLGEGGEHTISVRIERGRENLAAAARIASPQPGATVAGRTPVIVESDEAARVRYVIFLVDDVFKAMTNVRPFTYMWDTTRYLNGLHELQVKAYMSGGDQALSPGVEVRVDNPSGATAMREPDSGSAAAAARSSAGSLLPARAEQPTMPPAMHTESPTPLPPTITVAEPEIGLPGTAPFASPTGDLVRPPARMAAGEAGRLHPIQITSLPAEESSAGTREESAQARPTSSPAPPELSAVSSAKAEPAGARTPQPAEIEIALLPAEAAPPRSGVRAARSVAASGPEDASAMSAPAAAAFDPAASSTQIAMLPPRPAERRPAPKVAAAPSPAGVVYLVQPGDWLWAIAAEYGVSPKQLARANGISDAGVIHPGQRLVIPATPVYFDSRPLVSEVPTTITNGRAIVQFRPVIEEAGGRVVWKPADRRASAVARGHEIAVTIGSDRAQVNGRQMAMSSPAALRCNRTVVPLRFLGDVLDLVLQYEDGVIHVASGR
jgi:LysM repeat protein